MKQAKHELKLFLAGIIMLGVGLFIFSQRVTVHSGFYTLWGFGMGGSHLTSGVIIIPFIIGIIWLFVSGGSLGSKILTGFGVLFVIVAVIISTRITLSPITLFEWIIILILIFGGAGLIARVLFGGKEEDESGYKARKNNREKKLGNQNTASEETSVEARMQAIEEELEELKKKL